MKRALSTALAAFTVAALVGGVSAQGVMDTTPPERIKISAGKVDGAFIRANARTSRDWPSHAARR